MKILRVVFAGLVGLSLAALAQASTQITVRFDLGQAPAPRVMFHGEPHVVYVPEQRVYVVDDPDVGDYDCFRYNGYWYAFSGGYWYRSPRWNGHFVIVHPAKVPMAIYRVPEMRWKHRAIWTAEKKEMRREERRDDRQDHDDHDDHGHGSGNQLN